MKPSTTRRVVYAMSRVRTWQPFAALLTVLGGALLALVGGIVYGAELRALLAEANKGALVVGVGILACAVVYPISYILILAKDIHELRDELATTLAARDRSAGPTDGSDAAGDSEGRKE